METLKAISKRKSTRAFLSEKKISKRDLQTILEAGCAAPVGMGDYASIHLTVIQNPEALENISSAVRAAFKMDRDALYGAPTLVLVSASENQKSPNIQYANVACIIENMLLAAADLGIDSVYLWSATNVIAGNADLCKQFEIPEGFKPISSAALGYAVENNPTEKELDITISVNYVN